MYCPFGYERVYLSLGEVADTPFYIQRDGISSQLNPYSAMVSDLKFYPLEVVSRYREPQLPMGENYSYLFNLGPNIWESSCWNAYFVLNYSDFIG